MDVDMESDSEEEFDDLNADDVELIVDAEIKKFSTETEIEWSEGRRNRSLAWWKKKAA